MSKGLLSLGLLWLRVAAAGMLAMGHGWPKASNFDYVSTRFPGLFGLDAKMTLMLAIVGELVCPVLVALGLLTRFAALGSAITMVVALSVAHAADPWFLAGEMKITTVDKTEHVGSVTSEDGKQVVIKTADGEVTVPRSDIASQTPVNTKEPAILYLIPFAALVFTGPGCVSIDALIFRKRTKPLAAEPAPRNTTRPI